MSKPIPKEVFLKETGSSKKGRGIIKDWFKKRTDIKTIVDLGPGPATYPKLLGKDKYIWKTVEVWGPFVKKYKLRKFYSEIRIGDIQYMELPDGDCCIAGSVLEHLEREAMIKTFKRIDKQFRHVVIKIPILSYTQAVVDGNWFEKHLSYWTFEELEELIPPTYKVRELIDKTPAVFIK